MVLSKITMNLAKIGFVLFLGGATGIAATHYMQAKKPPMALKKYKLFEAQTECLRQAPDRTIENIPKDGVTSPHLTITDYKFIADYGFRFTRTPIRGDLGVYAEGCSDTDESVLVYRLSDDTPLFYRSGNVGKHDVRYGSEYSASEEASLRKLSTLIDASNIVLRHGYTGNCGGCYSAFIFTLTPTFKLLRTFYYDPAKYDKEHDPVLKEYDQAGELTALHILAE